MIQKLFRASEGFSCQNARKLRRYHSSRVQLFREISNFFSQLKATKSFRASICIYRIWCQRRQESHHKFLSFFLLIIIYLFCKDRQCGMFLLETLLPQERNLELPQVKIKVSCSDLLLRLETETGRKRWEHNRTSSNLLQFPLKI